MAFTDIFIKRPVLATVVSLAILLVGLRSGSELSIRKFPHLQTAKIEVTVAYPGADAELIQGFVTTPLERAVAEADGIDMLTSQSQQSVAKVTANLLLSKDPNDALSEISAKVNEVRSELPEGTEDPVIQLSQASSNAAMYLSFTSDILDNSQITDYVTRVVRPELTAVPGVANARIIGASTFAMRIWLRPDRLRAHNISANEVFAFLRANNFLSTVGQTKGQFVSIGVRANTDINTVEEFRQLAVRSDGLGVVRLNDIAHVELGAESYDQMARFSGVTGIFIAIESRPDSNVLEVVEGVRAVWPRIEAAAPNGLDARIGFDSTDYIRSAIREVQLTLFEAVIIVVIVIFLFIGTVRASLIPAVTVPLSLIGIFSVMLFLGFSINLLTLLAMVLAIGMVVDDAIIVLENVHRHIEAGLSPHDAAIKGARELIGPVIAMTITLMVVYLPIGFLTGITGKLFAEFAFTLAGAVFISGIIALTLTPMMCARILQPLHGQDAAENRLEQFLDEKFEQWRQAYKRRLHSALDTVHVVGVFSLIIVGSCYFLFASAKTELAPDEDGGFLLALTEADGYSTLDYFNTYSEEAERITSEHPEIAHSFAFAFGGANTANSGFTGIVPKPWGERESSSSELVDDIKNRLSKEVAGLRAAVFQPPSLPTPGQGYPISVVLKSTSGPRLLHEVGQDIIARAMATGKFIFLAPDLKFDRPEAVIEIDRDKAALLGISMQAIGSELAAQLAGGYSNRFSYESRAYKVIPQIQRWARLNPEQLESIFIRAGSGQLIPLSTIATIREHTVPRSLSHVQQQNANTIQGVQRPDISQGEALAELERIARIVMPEGMSLDYAGSSRQFKQEGSAMLLTFVFALVAIYLVLSAQFESFRDPLIMLVSVPMSISGALLFINLFDLTNSLKLTTLPGMSLNIYTQVGLITLIGVITKHGILIVEFANKLQLEGLSKREAVEEATSIRFRPILMTTGALVIAMLPLLISTGPGAAARFSMGLVIATGMTIGTLFTLYVVPAMYLYIGRDYSTQRLAQPNRA